MFQLTPNIRKKTPIIHTSFYAVYTHQKGRQATKRVFLSWDEAKPFIVRIKGVRHQRFLNEADAWIWLNSGAVYSKNRSGSTPTVRTNFRGGIVKNVIR